MKKIFSAIIIIAMTCSLSAPAFAVEQNVSGGAVIATGNSIYWSTAGGTATAATGVNLAAAPGGGVAPAGVSAFANSQSNTNISFAGNSTVAGSLGDLTGGSLTLVTLAGSGSTVSLGANTNSYVTTTNFSNTANASTTLSLASGANLTGNITNTTSNTGTLSLADGGHTINGNIGSTGVGLNQVNVGIGTSAINGNVTATNFAFTGNGGNLSIGAGDSITTANPITVAVDSATTITYLGTTTIGSDLGSLAGNKFAFVNFNGGTVTLGANIYTSTASWTNAATTVNGAILNLTGPRTIGGNLILESGSITGAGETLTLNGGGSYTMQSGSVSAILGGAVALNKTTAGTVILSGANTYSGATTVSGGGTLQISATNGLGNTSGTTISGGSTLESTNNSYSLATSITLGAGGGTIKTDGGSNTLTLNGGVATSGNTLTVTGAGTTAINTIGISGGGGLTMSGSQNLFLGATNNYSGATVVNSGTITLGAGATLGNGTTSGVTLNNADLGGLNLNGNNITVGYLNGAAGSTINSTGAGGTLTTGANNDATDTMAGAIEGAGGFTKVGTGTQVLSGANTYSGATTVSGGGTLQISATNGLGNTSGTTISGGSTLESTNNSYSLATSITLGAGGGTIKTDGGSNTLTLNGGVATSGNTLTVTGAGTTAINTIGISGGGGLTMSGSQNLFLGATNNYSGATVVNSGTITLGAGATLGNGTTSGVTLNNADLGGLNLNGNNITVGYLNGAAGSTINSTGAGGTLTTGANNDATDTMAGAIEGAGGFTKVGTGTQVLSGANTYSGTTTISGTGTIQIGNGGTTGSLGTGAVTDNANLVFDRTDTPTVSNVISGTGTLTQEGVGGTLTLSGANSYSGGTTINANTTLLVGNAAALGTGAGVVANSGTLGIGTTNLILGNAYQQIAGSTLSLTANSPSSFGYITSNAGVSSVVAGSTVSVTVGGYIPNNANLTIIAGAGMAGAAPATVKTIGNSFVTFTDAISGNNLVLTAVRSGANSFAGQATDANGAAVGGVLDNITNPSSDMYNVLTALGNATPAQIASSEKSMSPTNDGSITQSAEAMLNGFTSGMSAHLESMRTQGDTTGIATGDNCLEGAGIWAQGLGDYADQTERGLSNGYTATSYGVTAGADILTCNDSIRVGIGSGFGQTFINSRDFSGNTDINSIPASIYGEYRDSNHPFYIDAAFTFIYNMYNGSRQVTAGPTITRTADAEYDGEQYSGYLEGGYSFFYKTLRLTPLVSFQYMHLHTSSYTETDAGALDLNVGSQDYDMAQTGLGAKLGYPVDTKYGTLLPDLHFKWLYDWIGDNQATTASFTGGGTSFGTNGFAPAQSGFDFGAKLDFKTKYNVTVGLDYDFLFKDDYYEQYGTVTARYTF